ncbi:hypothetical protein HYX10_05565 [Candidatus Woesearchaeota archaeon]|nr:hypothetical protein [Candidatus Woesearchaeota archaeon]
MAFSKRFPKRAEGSVYPKWVEVSLTADEEREVEHHGRQEHIALFKECIEDAKRIIGERDLKPYQSDIIGIASSLFDKRVSHMVYLKEKKCREKFDASN